MPKATEPKKVEAIRGLYESGMSPSEIADTMSLNVATIHRILVRIGAREPEKSAGKRMTDEQKMDIIKLYKEGMTVDEIEATVGCSKPTVYRYVNKVGLNRDIPKDKVAEAIRLYKETDLSVNIICEKVGISKSTFFRKLKKAVQDG